MQAADYAGTEGNRPMTGTTVETDILMALILPSDPDQVGITRRIVRATLEYHDLGGYADDAEIIASELVTNAIQHASTGNPENKIGVTLMRAWAGKAVSVIVTDSSRISPVKRETTNGSEHGRGLQLVESLSIRWGWTYERDGKAVYAILPRNQ